jgi:hypothetical protein
MLSVNAKGAFVPNYFIIETSSTSVDLRSTRVIQNLHKREGFRSQDGWTLRWFVKTLLIKPAGGGASAERVAMNCEIPFLIHSISHCVITLQAKAWMDQIRFVMYFHLVIKPWMDRNNCIELLYILDNCGSHLTVSVAETALKFNVNLIFLPKNCTQALAVLDLVVNKSLKTLNRERRVSKFYDHVCSHVQALKRAERERSTLPELQLLTVGAAEVISVIRDIIVDDDLVYFRKPEFVKTVTNAFVTAGIMPDEKGQCKLYRGRYQKPSKESEEEKALNLHKMFDSLTITPYEDPDEVPEVVPPVVPRVAPPRAGAAVLLGRRTPPSRHQGKRAPPNLSRLRKKRKAHQMTNLLLIPC